MNLVLIPKLLSNDVEPEFDVDPLYPLGVEDPRSDGNAVMAKFIPEYSQQYKGNTIVLRCCDRWDFGHHLSHHIFSFDQVLQNHYFTNNPD